VHIRITYLRAGLRSVLERLQECGGVHRPVVLGRTEPRLRLSDGRGARPCSRMRARVRAQAKRTPVQGRNLAIGRQTRTPRRTRHTLDDTLRRTPLMVFVLGFRPQVWFATKHWEMQPYSTPPSGVVSAFRRTSGMRCHRVSGGH
jgi:hypothetical protein